MHKIQLVAQEAPGHDPRTGHLRPVIEYLLAQGNRPAQWWQEDGWRSDPGGEMHYIFTDPLDAAQLREHFAFPEFYPGTGGRFDSGQPQPGRH